MSTDWQNLMKQVAAMKAATAPFDMWKDISRTPALMAFQKRQIPVNSVSQMIQEMFKTQQQTSTMRTITDALKQSTIKGNSLMSPAFWESVSSIAQNQNHISSIFSKQLSQLPRTIRAQVSTPSFASTAFPMAFNTGFTSKLATMQEALKGISKQITIKGFEGVDIELLKKFQKTTDEAVAITEEMAEKPSSLQETIERLEIFVGTSIENFKAEISDQVQKGIKKSQKSTFALISLWINVVALILTLITIAQSYRSEGQGTKPVTIREEQVKEFRKYVDEKFQKALDDATIKLTAKIDCNLRYNPSIKSSGFFRIKAGSKAHIVESLHKWIHITVIDPEDNLPISGWVLKKYFRRDN